MAPRKRLPYIVAGAQGWISGPRSGSIGLEASIATRRPQSCRRLYEDAAGDELVAYRPAVLGGAPGIDRADERLDAMIGLLRLLAAGS